MRVCVKYIILETAQNSFLFAQTLVNCLLS